MSLDDAYDPAAFRAAGHRAIDAIADYLGRAAGRELPVLPRIARDALLAELETDFAAPSASLAQLLERLLEASNHVHHPALSGTRSPRRCRPRSWPRPPPPCSPTAWPCSRWGRCTR